MIVFKNRNIVYGLILSVIVIVILIFDTVFDLLLELIHVSFELIEHWLDILIEHVFHTDLHDTQIIVFYIMLSIAGFALYKLYKLLRTLSRWYREVKENFVAGRSQFKKEILVFWQELTATGKTKWLMGFMAGFTCMIIWVFM